MNILYMNMFMSLLVFIYKIKVLLLFLTIGMLVILKQRILHQSATDFLCALFLTSVPAATFVIKTVVAAIDVSPYAGYGQNASVFTNKLNTLAQFIGCVLVCYICA